jgi:hypothetical protein
VGHVLEWYHLEGDLTAGDLYTVEQSTQTERAGSRWGIGQGDAIAVIASPSVGQECRLGETGAAQFGNDL